MKLTNKITALFLTMVILLFGAVGVMAEEFDVTAHVNPFTGRSYEDIDFYGNGTIIITLSHEKSIVWREYTKADFPELELEMVETLDPMADYEGRKNNGEYRGFVHITLMDKSNKAVIEAIELLYERCEDNLDVVDGDLHLVVPMSKTYYDKPEVDIPITNIITFGDVNNDYIINLKDVTLMLKYIAKWDNIKIEFKAADMNFDGLITLTDVTAVLRFIAQFEEK